MSVIPSATAAPYTLLVASSSAVLPPTNGDKQGVHKEAPVLADVELKVSSVSVSIEAPQASRQGSSSTESRQIRYIPRPAITETHNIALRRVVIVAVLALCGLIATCLYSRD